LRYTLCLVLDGGKRKRGTKQKGRGGREKASDFALSTSLNSCMEEKGRGKKNIQKSTSTDVLFISFARRERRKRGKKNAEGEKSWYLGTSDGKGEKGGHGIGGKRGRGDNVYKNLLLTHSAQHWRRGGGEKRAD